jgi:hypothetical protein
MRKISTTNSALDNNKAFVAIRSNKIEVAFKKLLAVGEKISHLTGQIKAEIKKQKNKNELEFLQKLKPKIINLAQLHQEELGCIEVIKHNEAEIASGTELTLPLLVPLFILEEKIWKIFGLFNPWAELKLQNKTLLELAIENEIEQQTNSAINYEELQFKQQIANWRKELSLLGVSVHYKTNSKLNQHEFEKLLHNFAIEHQTADNELGFDLIQIASKLPKPVEVKPVVNINVKEEIEQIKLAKEHEDPQALDKFLQEMEDLTRQLDEIPEMTESGDILPKVGQEKKQLPNINLSTIDQEIEELLNPKPAPHQSNPFKGYLERFFTGTLGLEETTDNNPKKELVIVNPLEKNDDKQQQLLKLDGEIADYIEKMDIVINGSLACDARLFEYLKVRIKCIARLLIEKDFLLQNGMVENKEELEHYMSENLAEQMKSLASELLEPIKETLISNINKENQEIRIYNNKKKQNKPLKILHEYDWKAFSKKLLDGFVS